MLQEVSGVLVLMERGLEGKENLLKVEDQFAVTRFLERAGGSIPSGFSLRPEEPLTKCPHLWGQLRVNKSWGSGAQGRSRRWSNF